MIRTDTNQTLRNIHKSYLKRAEKLINERYLLNNNVFGNPIFFVFRRKNAGSERKNHRSFR